MALGRGMDTYRELRMGSRETLLRVETMHRETNLILIAMVCSLKRIGFDRFEGWADMPVGISARIPERADVKS